MGEINATCGEDSFAVAGKTQPFQASQISWTGAALSNFMAPSGSVFVGKIRYQDNSTYTSPVATAKDRWNLEGSVVLQPNTALFELTVKDVNRPDFTWTGLYTNLTPGPDFIEFNTPKMVGRSFGFQAAVAMHEFGHAMRMRHNCPGELLAVNPNQVTFEPQEIDLAVYHAMWG